MNKLIIYLYILIFLLGCKSKTPTTFTPEPIIEPIQFTEILMKCMDIVTKGGNLNAIINTKQQYDSLIYARFQKPLDDYWNQNYESTLLL